MVFKKKIDEAIKEEIEEKESRPVQPVRPQVEVQRRPIVMAQLPTKAYRKIIDETTGEQFEAVSYDEALQEILETVRELKKAVI